MQNMMPLSDAPPLAVGGLKAVIDNSRRAVYGYDQRVEVFGSAGSIEAENDRPNTVRTMSATGTSTDRPLWFFLERYAEAYAREAHEPAVEGVFHDRVIHEKDRQAKWGDTQAPRPRRGSPGYGNGPVCGNFRNGDLQDR